MSAHAILGILLVIAANLFSRLGRQTGENSTMTLLTNTKERYGKKAEAEEARHEAGYADDRGAVG